MDSQQPTDGPRAGDRDDFGRVYRPHRMRAGCAVLFGLVVALAMSVVIAVVLFRALR